ncbi:hypothetical protein CLV59_105255 [Chitinophaga dinghuensis]|uniref:Uncharacterized protein n=1 Tax=Chitinophaga dinghuensis TaxID=1539050 RepID=A0A327VVX1_9BACT|nr:hypothetical protein [Chitinophaga dinghuensis]RAJ80147.1 hypothetical protein CLV59_105255 [Chitinophaga dinghuensis]
MGIIKTKYNPLFAVSVQQLFYDNSICQRYQTTPEPDFDFVPTTETLQLLDKMDLVFKPSPTSGGLWVLARVGDKTGGGNYLLRYQPPRAAKLSFLMLARNPELYNFNDLPLLSGDGSLYYFSNNVGDTTALRSNLHLSKDVTGVKGSNDRMKYNGDVYTFVYSSPVAPGNAYVVHQLTGTIIQPRAIINDLTSARLLFDLSALPSGICKLFVNAAQTDIFYYLPLPAQGNLFGIIEIDLSPNLDANYRVIETDRSLQAPAPMYTIQFTKRKTTWRYRLSLTQNSPLYREMAALSAPAKSDFLNRLNIVSNDTAITFTKGNVADLAIEFVSNSPIALQEVYTSSSSSTHDKLGLQLKKYIGIAQEATVKADLPYPSLETVNQLQPPNIYSDIFLTL